MSDDLDARLRAIVIHHTVLGGYPDTMAIARDAYALAQADAAPMAAAPLMQMERTVWQGPSKEDEFQPMDAWIAEAPHADLDRLLTVDIRMDSAADQQFLMEMWSDFAAADGRRGDMLETADLVTYHWRDADRIALRRAVETLRSDHLEPDPNQGTLL